MSTDDAEIAKISKSYGAEVIIRPHELSGDDASSESAILHVLKSLGEKQAYNPDLIVFLQCTAPLTLPEDIEGTIHALIDRNADSAMTVALCHHFLWVRDEQGQVVGINHDKYRRERRQDRAPQYAETGSVYVMRTDGFLTARHRFFGSVALHEIPSERWLEIDEPHDLKFADLLVRNAARIQGAHRNSMPTVGRDIGTPGSSDWGQASGRWTAHLYCSGNRDKP